MPTYFSGLLSSWSPEVFLGLAWLGPLLPQIQTKPASCRRVQTADIYFKRHKIRKLFRLPQSQKTPFSSGFFLLSMKTQMILKLCSLEGFLYYMIQHILCLLALKCSRHPLPLPQDLHVLTYCPHESHSHTLPCLFSPCPGPLYVHRRPKQKWTTKLKKSTPSLSFSQVTSHGPFLGPSINFISVNLIYSGNIKGQVWGQNICSNYLNLCQTIDVNCVSFPSVEFSGNFHFKEFRGSRPTKYK